MSALRLRRLCAGTYETRDGVYTVVLNPAGWVAYRTADPLAADRYETLTEVREHLAAFKAADPVGYASGAFSE